MHEGSTVRRKMGLAWFPFVTFRVCSAVGDRYCIQMRLTFEAVRERVWKSGKDDSGLSAGGLVKGSLVGYSSKFDLRSSSRAH